MLIRKDVGTLTEAQKLAYSNLIQTLVTGAASGLNGDAASAQLASEIEIANNENFFSPIVAGVDAKNFRNYQFSKSIGSQATRFAINLTDGVTASKNPDEPIINALRHAILTGLIFEQYGEVSSHLVVNYHEDSKIMMNVNKALERGDTTFNSFTEADTAVDLINNQYARYAANSNAYTSDVDFAKSMVNYFYNNGYYAVNPPKTGTAIVKKQMTSQEYQKIMSNLDTLGNSGSPKSKEHEKFGGYYD